MTFSWSANDVCNVVLDVLDLDVSFRLRLVSFLCRAGGGLFKWSFLKYGVKGMYLNKTWKKHFGIDHDYQNYYISVNNILGDAMQYVLFAAWKRSIIHKSFI